MWHRLGEFRSSVPFEAFTRFRMNVKKKLNSVALVRKQTIPTERPPLDGEVSANLCGKRVLRGQRN
jgi:hypothetical protein